MPRTAALVLTSVLNKSVLHHHPPEWKKEAFVSLMSLCELCEGFWRLQAWNWCSLWRCPILRLRCFDACDPCKGATCHRLGAAAHVVRNCSERAVNICVFSSAIWGKVGKQFWCLIYVSSSTPVVALSWKTPGCWTAQQNLISSSAEDLVSSLFLVYKMLSGR